MEAFVKRYFTLMDSLFVPLNNRNALLLKSLIIICLGVSCFFYSPVVLVSANYENETNTINDRHCSHDVGDDGLLRHQGQAGRHPRE